MNKILELNLKNNRNHLNDKDECFLLKEYIYNENIRDNIIYSIITPIYNQENIIVNNINSFLKHTLGTFEIILILDFCSDNTETNIINFFDNYKNINNDFYGIRIFKQDKSPIFEASCDNIGFINSYGKYSLEIQADMEMVEIGYNLELSKPFNLFSNVFAVSGRCAHNIFNDNGIGKLGHLIERSIEDINVKKNNFYVFETCNRGPLLFCNKKLKEINFLDEKNYHMENSDHDAMVRAYLSNKYICGYVPINFKSPLNNGSTRKNNTNNNINEHYLLLRLNQQEIKNFSYLISGDTINKYRNIWKSRDNITYDITDVSPILF